MTFEEFEQRALRTESEGIVTYDLRPFGSEQLDAAAVFLGHLVFRKNLSGQMKPGSIVLAVDGPFSLTHQLEGFVGELKPFGIQIFISACKRS